MAGSKIIDRGWMKIKSDIQELQGQGVKVGLRSSAGSHDGVLIADIGIYNEFGTSRIPARPFMRRTADQSRQFLAPFVSGLTKRMIEHKLSVSQVMNQLGLFYQDKIRNTIRSSPTWAVPNAPSTIKKKGSSVPLIDTGAMLGAVDYERTKI
jgi:hypothetical protein